LNKKFSALILLCGHQSGLPGCKKTAATFIKGLILGPQTNLKYWMITQPLYCEMI